MTLPRARFGSTGHESSRVVFGAAALAAMKRERADGVLALLLERGVNHIDTAAGYGGAEACLAPWLREHRARFFLATKTYGRTAAAAREDLHRSLERMGVDAVDMVQLHNLVDEAEWQTALGPGGALEALLEARGEGLVRFLGVTGHGTLAPAMHLRSLERFPFDAVLAPCNHTLLADPDYAADFAALAATCAARGVALQTIKAVARRRWRDEAAADAPAPRRFSWYEPLTDREAIRRAVSFVLARPGLFLASSSDARILPAILDAAEAAAAPSPEALAADVSRYGMEPLFVRGVSDAI